MTIRKHAFAAAMAGFAFSAHSAAWIEVADKTYIDAATIVIMRPSATKVWVMRTFDSPQNKSESADKQYMSVKTLIFTNCSERTNREIAVTTYSGENGSGRVVESLNNNLAVPYNVIPDTLGEAVHQKACSYLETVSKHQKKK